MEKKKYCEPRIEWIPLDNYISLQLASEPPIGPNETFVFQPEYLKTNPFQNGYG